MVVFNFIDDGSTRKIILVDQENLDRWLLKQGIQSLRQGAADGPEVDAFRLLKEVAESTTSDEEPMRYYPGPPIKNQQRSVATAPENEPTNDLMSFLRGFTPQMMNGLAVLAADALSKKRTFVLSEATMTRLHDILDFLQLPVVGASWPNKPSTLRHFDTFQWLDRDEDSQENRTAYMAHLNSQVNLPAGYSMADVQPTRSLLDVKLPGEEGLKISGTTDVVIAKSTNIQNAAIRNQVEALLELKKPEKMQEKDHNPQAIGELLAASYLNRSHGLVSILTDLRTSWTIYWLGRKEDGSGVALCKLKLDELEGAKDLAKYILESLNDKTRRASLPTGFADRLSFDELIQSYSNDDSSTKRQKRGPGGSGGSGHEHGNLSSQGSKDPPSEPRGGGNSPSGMDAQAFVAPNFGDGPSQMDRAATLRRFAFQPNNDVADELDLLDMVDEREQHEIIRAFAMKNMVPYMIGRNYS